MIATHTPGPTLRHRREGRVHLAALFGPLYVIGWFVTTVEPFGLLLPVPGAAASVLLPGLGVCVLLVTPFSAIRRVPMGFALLALLLWMTSSFVWSDSLSFTFLIIRNEVPALFLLWLVVGSMPPKRATRTLLLVFAVVGIWSLVTSLTLPMSSAAVQGFGPEAGLQEGWRGTFGHKNTLGIFVVFGIGLLLTFERRPRWRQGLLAGLVLVCVGTRSATAASGLMATVVAYFWLTALSNITEVRSRVVVKLALITSVVVAVLLVFGLLPMLVGIYGKDLTFSGRTEIWAAVIEVIDDRPIVGYGIGGVWFNGASEITFNLHQKIGFGASHAHSGLLNLWLESGLIGVGLFLALLMSTVRAALRGLRRPETTPYGQWAIMAIVALILMSLSEPLFRNFGLGVVVIVWTLLTRVDNDVRRDRPVEDVGGALPWWRDDDQPADER